MRTHAFMLSTESKAHYDATLQGSHLVLHALVSRSSSGYFPHTPLNLLLKRPLRCLVHRRKGFKPRGSEQLRCCIPDNRKKRDQHKTNRTFRHADYETTNLVLNIVTALVGYAVSRVVCLVAPWNIHLLALEPFIVIW